MIKRKLSMVLAAIIAVGTLASCGGDSSSSTSSGTSSSDSSEKSSSSSSADAGETVKLSVELFDRANVPEGQGTLEDNRWTKWAKEEMLKLGIELTYVPVPRGEETQKLNILLASNAAPDISFTYSSTLFSKFATEGGLHVLNEPFEKYGQDIVKLFNNDAIFDYGKIGEDMFAIPAKRGSTNHYLSYIRKDWLDKAGLEVPKTKDELTEVLKQFKEKNPGGVDNALPWGAFPEISSDFKPHGHANYDAMYSFFESSTEIDYSIPEPLREGFKEYVQWMNTLYNEGLIDPEFSTKNAEIKKQNLMNGEIGFYTEGAWTEYNGGADSNYGVLTKNIPDAELMPIEVFENSKGEYIKTHYAPAGLYLFVPKTAKNPEAAIKYLNWMAGEEVLNTLSFGIEGEHYKMEDGIPKTIDAKHNADTFAYVAGDMKLILNGTPLSFEQEMANNKLILGEHLGNFAEQCQTLAAKNGIPQPVFMKELPSESKYGPEIANLCDEYWVKMVTAKDFEATYATFMTELKARGIDEIQAERTAYYNEFVK